jgi:hypothetical protein
MAYREAELCTEIVRSINILENAWAYKIPDISPHWRGKEIFSPARAFDIIACVSSKATAIEAKLIKGSGPGKGGLSRKRITGFELSSLRDVADAQGDAYLALCWVYPKAEKDIVELFLLSIYHYDRIVWDKNNTIPKELLIERAVEVQWLGNGLWDMSIL